MKRIALIFLFSLFAFAGWGQKIITNEGKVIYAYDANQPLNISTTCEVWLDGKDASTFTLDGNYVDSWADKGSLGADVVNTNDDATRPTYDASTGRVTFTASNSTFLQSAAFSSALSQPNTVFVVYKITGGLSNNEGVFDARTNTQQLFYNDNFRYYIYAGHDINTGGGTSDTDDHIHVGLFNGINSEYWIDGISRVSGDVGVNTLDGITLGARGGLSNYANAEICEVIIYNADISDRDRDVVTTYLANKWNITATTENKGFIIRQD